MNEDREFEETLRRLAGPVDRRGVWANIEARAARERWAIGESGAQPRARSARKLNLRVAVFASVAVVLVAAIAVGTLQAVEHLGNGAPVVIITDDVNIGTGTTIGTTPATVWESGDGTWHALTVTVNGAPVRGLVVDPSDPSLLYATTDQGLFRSTDAAAKWVRLFSETARLVAVDPASPSQLYAIAEDWEQLAGENWVLVGSSDGGASWQVLDDSVLQTDSSPTAGAQGFVFDTTTSPSTVYYYGFGLQRSADRGETWTDLIAPQASPDSPDHPLTETPVDAVALDLARPGTIYAVTHYDAALLVRSTDRGASWEEFPSGVVGQPEELGLLGEPTIQLGIDPADPSKLYQSVLENPSGVVTRAFAQSIDQGKTWTVLTGAAAERARTVLDLGPGASAGSIEALLTLSRGEFPSPPEWMPVGSRVVSAATDDPPTLYVFGGSGVYKSTDGGTRWDQANSGLGYASVDKLVVDPASPGTVYACTEKGIGKSTDGGATWATVYEGAVDQLLVAPSHSSVLYAWTLSGLLRSLDAGATWEKRACVGLPDLAGNVAGGPQWMAGEEFKLASVAADTPDTLYLYDVWRSGESSLYRSTDGGNNWQPCATGDATVLGSLVFAPGDPSTVYAAGTLSPTDLVNYREQSTGLMTSKDGGASWTYQEAPTGILAIAVDARDAAALYLLCGDYNAWSGTLVAGSTLYRSADGGNTWQEIKFEHLGDVEWLTADPRLPRVVYAASLTDKDGDKVFRTEAHLYRSLDEGATWEDMSGDWPLDREKFPANVQYWCTWSFAADLVADQTSGIAFYAIKHMGRDELPVSHVYKWASGD